MPDSRLRRASEVVSSVSASLEVALVVDWMAVRRYPDSTESETASAVLPTFAEASLSPPVSASVTFVLARIAEVSPA